MRKYLFGMLLLMGTFSLSAADAQTSVNATPLFLWTILMGGMALTVAAVVGAFAQMKAITNAADNIGRNPAAADSIRTLVIIGLAFIESLVIYVLLVDLILFFIKWGKFSVIG